MDNQPKADWMQPDHDMAYVSARSSLREAWSQQGETENFEDFEPHVSYGFKARRQFEDATWNNELEQQLQYHWPGDWQRDRGYIRRGWELARTGAHTGRPPLIAKPFDQLPETPKQQPAITNHTPDTTHRTTHKSHDLT